MSNMFTGLDPEEVKALKKEMRSKTWAVYIGELPETDGETVEMWGQTFKEGVPTLCDPKDKMPHELAYKLSCMLGSFKTFKSEEEAKKFAAGLKKPKAVAPPKAATAK